MKKRATFANKISGKKRRERTYRRDLRGRFTIAQETSRSPGDFSREGKRSIRKIRPTAAIARQLKRIPKKRTRLRK